MRSRVAIAAVLAACGTDPPSWIPDAGPCVAYVNPVTTDLTTPAMSFAHDVMPVLTSNCSSSSCHGIADNPKGELFLGAQLAKGADATTVFAGLVGPMSAQLKSMPFVTPGDPTTSYIMHKLDDDQCTYETSCISGNCMASMPFASQLLVVEKRDIVRRWIAQGAQAN